MSDRTPETPTVAIIVADRGHVLVGRLSRHPDLAFHWRLEPGRIIRRWGTSEGLAQLARGPLESTVLDAPANVSVPFRAVLYILDAEAEGWLPHLPVPTSAP
jgi:hypothetical protein